MGGKKYPKKTGKTKLVTGDSHGEKNSFLSVTGLVAFFSAVKMDQPKRFSPGNALAKPELSSFLMGSSKVFRHSETQSVSNNATGVTPLREFAATYVAPDNAFPNYESTASRHV